MKIIAQSIFESLSYPQRLNMWSTLKSEEWVIAQNIFEPLSYLEGSNPGDLSKKMACKPPG